MTEHTSLILGEGRLKIVTVHGEGKYGLLITPMDEPHEVNSKFHGECGQPADIRPASIVIWAANLEGVRVLQDAVNSLALFMNGRLVEDQPGDWDPRTYELVRR